VALKLMHLMFAKLLDWMVLRIRSDATPSGPDRHKPTSAPSSLARPTKAARPGNTRTIEVWPGTDRHRPARVAASACLGSIAPSSAR